MAWCYFGGMLFFGVFLCLLLDHLEHPTLIVGVLTTLSLLLAQLFILKGVYMAASKSVTVLEDYVGDEVPLPLYQDPLTGEWVIKSELSSGSGSDMMIEDNTPYPYCIYLLSCCSTVPCMSGISIGSDGEYTPVLGARQMEEEEEER